MADFREYKLDKPKKKRNFFIYFLFFLVLIILLVFLYFSAQDKEGLEEVKVDFYLEAPKEIRIGQENQFIIKIANQEDYNLENIEVRVDLPDYFFLIDSVPQWSQKIEKGYIWFFKEIGQSKTKEIVFQAQDFNRTEKQFIDGSLNFNLSGFAPNFEKKFSSSFDLEPSILLEVFLPKEANLGQETKIDLSLKNLTDQEFSDLRVVFPENLFFLSQDFLKEEQGKIIWEVDRLLPREERNQELKAFLKAEIGKADLEFELEKRQQNDSFCLAKLKKEIVIKKPDVSLEIRVDNQETGGTTVWGKTLPVNILFQNKSQEELENFRIRLELKGLNCLNLEKLKNRSWQFEDFSGHWFLDQKDIKDNKKEIVWDKDVVSGFKSLGGNTSGQLKLNLFLKDNSISAEERIKKGEIDFKVSLDYLPENLEETERIDLVEREAKTKIKTDFNLIAEARYWSDDYLPVPIGEGPLPLKAGEETKLWLFFRLKNTSNPVEDILIKTNLEPKISWTGETQTTHGVILYAEEEKEFSWQISSLDAYQGGPYSLVEARVEIAIRPEEDDIGAVLPFTSEISYTAQDQFTGGLIEGRLEGLDSLLSDLLIRWGGEIR